MRQVQKTAHWSRTCGIVAVDEPQEIVRRTVATRLYPDSTEWSSALQPSGRVSRITQDFTALRAPWLLDRLVARLIPSHQAQAQDRRLAADLVRVGTAAQRGAPR